MPMSGGARDLGLSHGPEARRLTISNLRSAGGWRMCPDMVWGKASMEPEPCREHGMGAAKARRSAGWSS